MDPCWEKLPRHRSLPGVLHSGHGLPEGLAGWQPAGALILPDATSRRFRTFNTKVARTLFRRPGPYVCAASNHHPIDVKTSGVLKLKKKTQSASDEWSESIFLLVTNVKPHTFTESRLVSWFRGPPATRGLRVMLYDDRYNSKTLAAFIYKEITYTDKQKPKLKTTEKKKQRN